MKKEERNIIKDLLNPTKFKSQEYHSSSKYYFERIPKIHVEIPKEWVTIHFKQYQRFKPIKLAKPIENDISLFDAIEKRFSVRKYSEIPIRFEDLSTILHMSAGIKKQEENTDSTKRGQPSAGARFPVEIYIICLNCSELKRGFYHYNVKQDTLELLKKGFTKKELQNYFDQPWMFDSGCIILMSGVFGRTNIKYRERGYRYVLFEAGHIAQNICLVSTALGIGSCCIGGFADDKINQDIDLQEENEAVLYALVIGNAARS